MRDKRTIINQVSPDGKFFISCKKGIEFFELTAEKEYAEGAVFLKRKEWSIPLKTDDIDPAELEYRVRFETNSIVRYVNRDNRDILYQLDKDGSSVHYIGEVKVENCFKMRGHKLELHDENKTFEETMQRNSQITAFYRHI